MAHLLHMLRVVWPSLCVLLAVSAWLQPCRGLPLTEESREYKLKALETAAREPGAGFDFCLLCEVSCFS